MGKNTKVELLDFSASWCVPCKKMSVIIDGLKKEFENNQNINIRKIDVEEEIDLTDQYNIKNVPTLIFLKDSKEVLKLTGSQSKDLIKSKILEFI